MAITRIKSSNIEDGTVANVDIADLDSTKLTGTIATARLSNVDLTTLSASNLTTGTIPDARIPASAVTQHVAATDLTAVHQAIATLGLHTAVSDNKAAFNLPNAFIDTFEDDSGIATETTVDRVTADEYVASIYTSFGTPVYVTGDRTSTITGTNSGFSWHGVGGTTPQLLNGSYTANASNATIFTTGTPSAGAYIRFQFATAKLVTEAKWYSEAAAPGNIYGTWQWQGSDNVSTWTNIGSSAEIVGGSSHIHTELNGNTTAYTYYQLLYVSGTVIDSHWHMELEFKEAPTTTATNATGTLISDTQTAPSATTEVSGVILYKDNGSSSTVLGTHLKIYFTADNGSNWTEAASYGTPQTFSGTTKQVKLGKTTGLTSGTQVAMKAVWAGQASTTMETQLHGWAVNY